MRANDRGNRYPSGFSHWGSSTAVSLDPDREPITRPVFVWLEITAQLVVHGDGSLAAAIGQAMDGRRRGDNATFAFTIEEQRRVNAALQAWLGEHDPD